VNDSRVADTNTSSGPLALWLGIQLVIVVLCAARVPLAAQLAAPSDQLTPHLLLAVQVVASSLLFPFFFRDVRSAVQILSSAIPFQLAAAYLAGLGVKDVFHAAGFVQAWLVTLAVGAACLRGTGGVMPVVCLASCLTLGGGMVRYLRLEFSQAQPGGETFESASPLLTTLAAVEGQPTFRGWILLLSLAAAGLGVLAWKRAASKGANRRVTSVSA
jgi:hypothetical protein